MNLGVFLSSGSSFKELAKEGRDELFKDYVVEYCKNFKKVFIFSYINERRKDLPPNCYLLPNKFNLNRFLYSFILPFVYKKYLKKCHILRVMQLLGAVPAILSGKIYKIPVVSTYGYDYQNFALMEKKYFPYLLLKFLELWMLKNLKGIITTTSFLEEKIKNKTNCSVYLIPNSVKVNLFKPKEKKLDHQKIKILSVGRLEKQKNFFQLIKAVSLLKYKNKVELVIIGTGSLREKLIAFAKKKKVNLKIISGISHNKMPYYYQNADIFCLVSLTEGHPKSLLEALSCGLPCVVTKNEGTQNIIKDKKNGIFTANKKKEIAEKIDILVKNKDLRKKISREARKNIVKHYSFKTLINKEINILRKIANENKF